MPGKKTFNRVLIIDDDYASIYLTKAILEDMEIAEQILTVSNGDKGLEKIKQNCLNEHAATSECPDLILIDINMPGLSGLEVVEELYKIGQSNLIQAKVVVLTASSQLRDMDKMIQFGVKQYIEKPITEEKISLLIGNKAL
jgi:CheY-like chemotaxis protein